MEVYISMISVNMSFCLSNGDMYLHDNYMSLSLSNEYLHDNYMSLSLSNGGIYLHDISKYVFLSQ